MPLMRRFTLPTAFAALAAVFATPSSVYAACLVRAQAGAALQELTTGVASANDATEFGSSSTTASFGRLSANSSVSLGDTQTDGGSTPIPIAHFEDDWTVTIPSQPGLFSGTLRFEVLLVGEPTVEVQAGGPGAVHEMNTGYQLVVYRNGGFTSSTDGRRIYATAATPELATIGTVPAPGLISIEVPVVFGVPMNLAFDLISSTGGRQVLSPGQEGSTLGRTNMALYWRGVTSIRDTVDNELLDQAVLTSCSGVDWLASQEPPPVPVGPAVPIGLGIGAAALGGLVTRADARRKRLRGTTPPAPNAPERRA
ncbi:MAG: hypothetical protein KC616_04250 [Myxococcales bacterium]|nr:hypothetical protein [Myxococcales bacterium]